MTATEALIWTTDPEGVEDRGPWGESATLSRIPDMANTDQLDALLERQVEAGPVALVAAMREYTPDDCPPEISRAYGVFN
jgi:hypothetical protein